MTSKGYKSWILGVLSALLVTTLVGTFNWWRTTDKDMAVIKQQLKDADNDRQQLWNYAGWLHKQVTDDPVPDLHKRNGGT